ncbi:MAG TPA: ABC transporter ATP-binding protein [Anaerolineales bacterium]
MTNTPILTAKDIKRSLPFNEHTLHILKGLTFTIDRGEWVALTGPSGSGKTTLLGILAAIDRPTSGEVSLEGQAIHDLPETRLACLRNEKIGIVFQAFNLIPTMSAQENVEVPLYIGPRRKQAARIAGEMLDLVGLGDRRHHLPHQLSGGEQQRVAIARALVAGPAVLFADEPTGNLDSATGKQVLDLITRLRQQFALTVVMVTHDASVAACADRRLHLVDGLFVTPPAVGSAMESAL